MLLIKDINCRGSAHRAYSESPCLCYTIDLETFFDIRIVGGCCYQCLFAFHILGDCTIYFWVFCIHNFITIYIIIYRYMAISKYKYIGTILNSTTQFVSTNQFNSTIQFNSIRWFDSNRRLNSVPRFNSGLSEPISLWAHSHDMIVMISGMDSSSWTESTNWTELSNWIDSSEWAESSNTILYVF